MIFGPCFDSFHSRQNLRWNIPMRQPLHSYIGSKESFNT